MSKRTIAALLTLLPSGLFIFFFLTDRFVFSDDTLGLFYVGKRWFWNSLHAGHFPLWNENLFGGFYIFASPANGFTSPVSAVLYNIFPSVLAEELQLPLFAVAAAVGMYLWLKRLTGSAPAALLVGLAYGLSGPLLSLADRSHIFYSVCLYPWAFYIFGYLVPFAEAGRHQKDAQLLQKVPGTIGAMACVLAMMLIHADWVAALILILLFCTLALRSSPRACGRVVVSAAWAIGLAALAILPSVLNVGDTTRAGGFTLEQTSYYSFHPFRLLSLLVPEAWGQPYNLTFYGDALANAYQAKRFWYHSIFIGLPVLLFAAAGLKRLRSLRYGWLGLALAVGFLCLSFGSHFFLHEFLYNTLPGYTKLRFPEKFLLYALFACFPLAAIVIAQISEWRPWLFVLGGLHALIFSVPFVWAEMMVHISPIEHGAHLVLAAALVVTGFFARRWAFPVLLAVTVAELWVYAPAFRTSPLKEFSEVSPFAATLQGKRYVRDGNLTDFVGFHSVRSLEPNWPMLSDLREAFGYESVTPFRSEALIGNEIFHNLEAWAPVLNVTYLVSTISPKPTDLKRLADKGLIEPLAVDNEVNAVLLALHRENREFSLVCRYMEVADASAAFQRVRERIGTLEPLVVESTGLPPPPADCGSSEVHLLVRTSERRVYSVKTTAPMWLVEREAFAQGWKAFVDGQEVHVEHVDFADRGLPVPAGEHRVETHFAPHGFYLAAYVSLFSALALLAYFAIWAKRTIPQLSKLT